MTCAQRSVCRMDEHILRRLAYSKIILLHGNAHSRKPTSIDNSVSILHFDNSIETFLYSILEFFGQTSKEYRFPDLVNQVVELLRNKDYNNEDIKEIINPIGIKNMHKARNTIQHHGILINSKEIIRYRNLSNKVASNITKNIFKIEFSKISLSNLVENDKIREYLKESEKYLGVGDYKNSIISSAYAFEGQKIIERMLYIN